MKKLSSLVAVSVALALAGCSGGLDDPAKKYREALPPADAVQLRAPAADGTAAPTALVASGALASTAATSPYPAQSEFATISYWSAVGINGGTWWTLTLVQFITDHRPTSCND